jgi:hypothetical protein
MDKVMEKLSAMSPGEKLIAAAGIVLLIASFLPWYKVSFSIAGFSASASANGWEAPGALFSILAVLIGLVMAIAVLAPKFSTVQLPDLGSSVTWGQAYLGAGVVALILVIIKFLNESSSLSYGFFLGFICVLALAAGGYMLYTEEKGTQPFWSQRR